MSTRLERSTLQVAKPIVDLLEEQVLPGTGLKAARFWDNLPLWFTS